MSRSCYVASFRRFGLIDFRQVAALYPPGASIPEIRVATSRSAAVIGDRDL